MSIRLAAIAALAAVGLCGCAGTSTAAPAETLRVFAAASLADAFTEIAADFEAAHPDADVRLTFAGSADLAAQIAEGAPADVFASANEAQMAAVRDATATPVDFATNTLTIVVPAGNPARIDGLADLTRADVTTVVCAPQVPCGTATTLVAAGAGMTLSPASEESSVTDVLGKVSTGQADAGIVYVTDVARAAGVESVPLEGADAVTNVYPIARLIDSEVNALADEFIAHVTSAEGRAVLAGYGFGAP